MMKNFSLFAPMLLLFLTLAACRQAPAPAAEEPEGTEPVTAVVAEAEDYDTTSHPVEILKLEDGAQVLQANEAGWVAFSVEVPVAGRYQTQLRVKPLGAQAGCWIEDYIDNPDGRTYNITSQMETADPEWSTLTKDGSPLNTGTHRMKIHFDGPVQIDWIRFELMKPHDVTPLQLTQQTEGSEWVVVWSDEFEGPQVDTSKWTYDIGNWGWGNNELQYYTADRPKNARIEDGNLIIEAHKDDMGEAWTSARLTTRGKVSFTYGKIEFRAKVPTNRGNWAAGWTLGDAYVDELSWPYCGEIDIMESVGYEMDDETGNGIAHASVHCGAYYFKLGNQPTAVIDVERMHDTFHTYAVEWTPEGITGLIDDQPYFEYTDNTTELAWPFDEPQNIILNLAMGGGWGGAQGMDESIVSQKMTIDYVRVYERR
jgi:beta-glucanase (GH16 family)